MILVLSHLMALIGANIKYCKCANPAVPRALPFHWQQFSALYLNRQVSYWSMSLWQRFIAKLISHLQQGMKKKQLTINITSLTTISPSSCFSVTFYVWLSHIVGAFHDFQSQRLWDLIGCDKVKLWVSSTKQSYSIYGAELQQRQKSALQGSPIRLWLPPAGWQCFIPCIIAGT